MEAIQIICRPMLVVALAVTAAGLVLESTVPASGRMIDIGAAVCGLATWIVPLLLAAMYWNVKPRSPFGGAGLLIRILVVAACLSATGVSLALLSLVFARGPNWAWPALVAIAAFWLSGGILIYVVNRRSSSAGQCSK